MPTYNEGHKRLSTNRRAGTQQDSKHMACCNVPSQKCCRTLYIHSNPEPPRTVHCGWAQAAP